jgi:hypothetical protein
MPTPRETVLANVNWDSLANTVGEALLGSLKLFAQGEAADLRDFGIAIARDLTTTLREPDEAVRAAKQAELKGQARTLAEIGRVRLNNEAWAQFDSIFDIASGVVTTLLNAAILAI